MPFTDWNQYLAAKDEPAQDEFAPMPDPMATFQMPTDSSVRPEQIGKAIEFMYSLRKHQQESRIAAQRWKGQQDYKRLFQQYSSEGDPESAARKALLGTAPDMFSGAPAQTASSLYNLSKPRTPMGVPGTVTPIMDATGRVIHNFVIGPDGKSHPVPVPTTVEGKKEREQFLAAMARIAEAKLRRTEKEWIDKGGPERTAPAATVTAYREARDEFDKTKQAWDAHISGMEQRYSNASPMPGAPGGIPLPPRPGVAAPETAEPTQEELRRAAGVKPTSLPKSAAAAGVRVRRKGDKKEFTYHGNAADVPKDKFDILP